MAPVGVPVPMMKNLPYSETDFLFIWAISGRPSPSRASDERPQMQDFIPPQPANSHRIVLELNVAEKRMDSVLLTALKNQSENLSLREMSRGKMKDLFKNGKVQIKGQKATPSSALCKGLTYVDIML